MKIYTYIFSKRNLLFVFFLLIVVGVCLRFFNIAWGAPFFFHPDERNIASSVTRLNFGNFDPGFYAYGGLPIYFIYFSGILVNFFVNLIFETGGKMDAVSFESAIIISRVFSAFFSVGILLLFFCICRLFPPIAFWVAFIASIFSVGFIQYAHFGTFEMWLTFFSFLLFVFLLYFFKTKKLRFYLLSSLVFGVLLGVKVSSIVLLPIFPLVLSLKSKEKKRGKKIFQIFLYSLLTTLVAVFIFLISNPFFILENEAYLSSLAYESSVAWGNLNVFYTGRFFGTIPVIFHFVRVFPFLVNPLNTVLLGVGIFVCSYFMYKRRDFFLFLVIVFFLLFFLPQTFLFVKWNRYMLPTLPFVYILVGFTVYFLVKLFGKGLRGADKLAAVFLFVVSVFFSLAFFVTVYFSDSRVTASKWAEINIPHDAYILSEVYDMGLVPFEHNFSNIALFNSYEFENGEEVPELSEYEYVILPSARILRSRIELGKEFPVGHEFYSNLYYEKGDFKLVYKTPCDILCRITYLGDPIFLLEETANVFDRPTVFIYEKK